MNNNINIADLKIRQQALDIEKSFIVQAPAGSGKTEILIQRYLKLLTVVNNPEEILAITFTKKAAAEMRSRIILALSAPDKSRIPDIITKALARDYQQGWNIIANPNRLKIMTIDSFCNYLTKYLPIESKLGFAIKISDNPENLYQHAIHNFFKLLNHNNTWYQQIQELLLALDNRFDLFEKLLSDLLATREQWLPFLYNLQADNILKICSSSLLKLTQELISDFKQKLGKTLPELITIADYCASVINSENINNKNSNYIKYCSANNIDNLAYWQGLSFLLFNNNTSKFAFRKRLDKNIGFIKTKTNNYKQDFLNILAKINNNTELLELGLLLRKIPDLTQVAINNKLLQCLAKILPVLIAELKLVFNAKQLVDFNEITNGALVALGDQDLPTDLVLKLDYQLQHILMDEFQDTSIAHFRILEKLVYNWDQDRNKSIFLVGDPMQSIYKFRQADVSLFLDVINNGIINNKLIYLQLSTNFRAEPGLIKLINNIFTDSFPRTANLLLGSVAYKQSSSAYINNNINNKLTNIKLNIFAEQILEEEYIITIINNLKQKHDDLSNISIAILLRNRSHSKNLLNILNNSNIKYDAISIEPLFAKMFIQDILSLIKAITCLQDKISWLACLRAPWCGLLLADLELVSNYNPDNTIWENINNNQVINLLSADSKTRINFLIENFKLAFANWHRIDFYLLIKNLWLNLGGDKLLKSHHELQDTELFFQKLAELTINKEINNLDDIISKLEKLYSNYIYSTSPIEIMTIHKSKGLEFDYVIIPYLDKTAKILDHKLLQWQEYKTENFYGLLMAPFDLNATNELYQCLRFIEKQQDYYESGRLLYVAITRAKKQCFLSGSLAADDKSELGFKAPITSSLLAHIWDYFKNNNNYFYHDNINPQECKNINILSNRKLFRLKLTDLKLLTADNLAYPKANDNPHEYKYTDNDPQIFGIYIHRLLAILANNFTKYLAIFLARDYKQIIKIELLRLGISLNKIDYYINQTILIFNNIKQDLDNHWIFAKYKFSRQEQAYNFKVPQGNDINKIVIDRIFIKNNIKWIIDYKIIYPEANEDLNSFINKILLAHSKQLQHYRKIISKLDQNIPIHLGLYLPLVPKFIQIGNTQQERVKIFKNL